MASMKRYGAQGPVKAMIMPRPASRATCAVGLRAKRRLAVARDEQRGVQYDGAAFVGRGEGQRLHGLGEGPQRVEQFGGQAARGPRDFPLLQLGLLPLQQVAAAGRRGGHGFIHAPQLIGHLAAVEGEDGCVVCDLEVPLAAAAQAPELCLQRSGRCAAALRSAASSVYMREEAGGQDVGVVHEPEHDALVGDALLADPGQVIEARLHPLRRPLLRGQPADDCVDAVEVEALHGCIVDAGEGRRPWRRPGARSRRDR
jgi:hypothetical protein